ncbi:MAG: Ig-like domain-containing protein, partial [Exilibacterium sp.]
ATTYRATITEDIFDQHANQMAVPFSWTFTTSTVDMGVELTNDPVFGSSSVVQDDSNHLEFLRLDFTTPYTYSEILAELNPGGDFEGWRIASAADLMLLGDSANIVHGHTEALMLARADLLRDWFCVDCVNLSTTHEVVRGLINDTYEGTDGQVFQQAFSIGRRLNVTPNDVTFNVSGYGAPDNRSEEVFLVRSTLDAVPPYVSSTAPDSGEINVAANRQITVTFSERIDPSTITTTSFLVNDGTTNIDGQLSSTSSVRDIAGNRMQSNYNYSFTTSGDILEVQLVDSADFGPNSVVRDASHRLEFLRLDFTTPYTYNEILAELSTGGTFEGWRIASGAEVALLGDSANIVMGSTDVKMLERVEQLRDWFCIDCVNLSTTHEYIRGLISDIYTGTDSQVFQKTFSLGRRFNITPNEVDFRVSGYGGQDNRSEEVFLVRDIYYAPASLSTADETEK